MRELTPIQQFQRLSKYARWNYRAGRRETWEETVDRYIEQLQQLGGTALPASDYEEMRVALFNLDAIGSMRTLAMAGPAFERDNLVGYNCAALDVDSFDAFYNLSVLGMAGVGVTYSVERRNIAKLPVVAQPSKEAVHHTVADSAEGWALAFDKCIRAAYAGKYFVPDLALIRPKGALLHTKGGRASGPEPLRKALDAVRGIIRAAVGRKLTPLEVSDVCCLIGEAVVSGGVRRTALMALFDADEQEMVNAKHGDWYPRAPWRANANFSKVLESYELTRAEVAANLWTMFSGEPSFFNRAVAQRRMSPLRRARLTSEQFAGLMCNPCGEAMLTSEELCNLSAWIAYTDDDGYELERKAIIAARMGTLQAKATYFPNLRGNWTAECDNEALLGAGFLGYADNPYARDPKWLRYIQQAIIAENRYVAKAIGVQPAAAVTAVKPAGNSGLFIGASSGIHPWTYPYMLRRVTVDEHEPLYHVLHESGVPMERKRSITGDGYRWLALFPMAAPRGALTLDDMTAVDQLNNLLSVTQNYTDHAVSITVTYRGGEEDGIIDWIYQNQADVVGCTFYKEQAWEQAPIERISAEEYQRRAAEFPQIRWELLQAIEQDDYTTGSQEVACGGGACDMGGEIMPGFTL